MSDDTGPTVWEADPHTLAKLRILESYLKAWMPILTDHGSSVSASEVLFVDAFAGPGCYQRRERGSPLVAVEVAKHHRRDFPIPVHLKFVEKRRDRWEHLTEKLEPHLPTCRNAIVDRPILGEAHDVLAGILDRRRGYTPTLVFLDQFGYSAVPMALITRILADPSCEVFAFMNWRDLDRYVSDPRKGTGISRAFGGDEWEEIRELQGRDRSHRFLELYDLAVRNRARAQFAASFALSDRDDRLLSWLVFCSNNDRGLEEMKRAMWSVDSTGHFRFSDKHSQQATLLTGYDEDWLAERFSQKFNGMIVSIRNVRHWVLTETPCYLYNEALARLERNDDLHVVNAPASRRKGSFKQYVEAEDDLMLRFERRPEQATLL